MIGLPKKPTPESRVGEDSGRGGTWREFSIPTLSLPHRG
jgi:hypothetical protein